MRPGRWAVAVAALALAPRVAEAQSARPERPRNVVTWQPLSLIGAYIDLEYERALGRHVSVYVAPGLIFFSGRKLGGSSTAGIYAGSLDVGGRWFIFGDAPSGFFVDAALGFYTSEYQSLGGDRGRGFGVRAMALAGYTWFFARHLLLSVGLGAQVRGFEHENGIGYQWNVWPSLRAAVGFAL